MTSDVRPAIDVPAPNGSTPAGQNPLSSQSSTVAQTRPAAEGQDSPQAMVDTTLTAAPPAGISTAPPASAPPTPNGGTPEGRETSHGHVIGETQGTPAVAADIPGGQRFIGTQVADAAGEQPPPATASLPPVPIAAAPWLADHDEALGAAAAVLTDIERVRIAAENRLRQFIRPLGQADKDGKRRGLGWNLASAPPAGDAVEALSRLIDRMKCDSEVNTELGIPRKERKRGEPCCLEHEAERSLTRTLHGERAVKSRDIKGSPPHPLGPWVQAQKGIGDKQGARLIAALRDPYMRPQIKLADGTYEPSRPRTVSELWAYCGLKPGQKRKRGERANWSAEAKMRAWNVAGSMLKAGNRETYDKRKALTESRLHASECVRCGPSGKPAQPGSPWSDAHRHADALRIVCKAVLKDMWREARRIHEQ